MLGRPRQLLPADRPDTVWLTSAFDAIAEGNPLPGQQAAKKPPMQPTLSVSASVGTENMHPATALATTFCVTVRRGVQGLGMALDAKSMVAELAAGGQAELDGLLEVGDQVAAVDGVVLDGRPMGEVITRGADAYNFMISRRDAAMQATLQRLPPDHPMNTAPKGTIRLLKLSITRDSNGLGLDMSGLNLLKKVVPGGAAEKSGGWLSGDLVVAVNGDMLGANRLVNMLPRGLREYTFTVIRAEDPRHAPVRLPAQSLQAQPMSKATPQPLGQATPPTAPSEAASSAVTAGQEPTAKAEMVPVTPAPPHVQHSEPLPATDRDPTDKELLEFLLRHEGRSRIGLLVLYHAWAEEEVVRRQRGGNPASGDSCYSVNRDDVRHFSFETTSTETGVPPEL